MGFSKLKNDLELLKMRNEHELYSLESEHTFKMKEMKMNQELKVAQLLATCNHKYDDGSEAYSWVGDSRGYKVCSICGKQL